MKKQFILVLAISTLALAGCEENVTPRPPRTTVHQALAIKITSFFPESAKGGTEVVIFGENFGKYETDHVVSFNNTRAEVTRVQPGMIVARVPMNLAEGDYFINISANGQSGVSTKAFKVTYK